MTGYGNCQVDMSNAANFVLERVSQGDISSQIRASRAAPKPDPVYINHVLPCVLQSPVHSRETVVGWNRELKLGGQAIVNT
jgi:hypothetical protein